MWNCKYYQKQGWQCQRCWHPDKMQENLGVVQMGTRYYCKDCQDGVPGKFVAPEQITITIPESEKRNEMM